MTAITRTAINSANLDSNNTTLMAYFPNGRKVKGYPINHTGDSGKLWKTVLRAFRHGSQLIIPGPEKHTMLNFGKCIYVIEDRKQSVTINNPIDELVIKLDNSHAKIKVELKREKKLAEKLAEKIGHDKVVLLEGINRTVAFDRGNLKRIDIIHKAEEIIVEQQLNNEPVQELNNEPVHELNNEPVHELNNEPVQELNNEPVQELNNEPVQQLNNEADVNLEKKA